MSKFVTRREDKFHNKVELVTKEVKLWSASPLYDMGLSWQRNDVKGHFRYLSTPDGDSFLLDVDYRGPEWMFFRNGDLVIRINDSRNIVLLPQGEDSEVLSQRNPSHDGNKVTCREVLYYEISTDDFKDLCHADSVEFQITGKRNFVKGEAEQLQTIARHLYNELYEEEAFAPQKGPKYYAFAGLIIPNLEYAEQYIKQVKEKIGRRKEERRIQSEEKRVKAEQKAIEKAARRKEWWQKNKTKVFVGIFIFIGAIIAAIFVVKHQAKAIQEKSDILAMQAFDAADSCMRVNNFDRAEEYYKLALEYANDEFLVQKCCICLTELDAERESYQYRHKKTKVNRTNTTLTNAELWEDFESAYIRYYGITSLNESTYSVAKKNIQNFLYAGKKEGADISRILTDYSSDWKWLGDYIQEVNSTQITSEIRWRFSVVAFFLANEGDSRYNVDFSWAGKPEAWRSAYQDAQ